MSTRANIIITDDNGGELIFYRHCDGYPLHCGAMLEKFLGWVRGGKIRDNVGQASGWLVLLGAMEYGTLPPQSCDPEQWESVTPPDWKAGAFEPTTGIHGDIDYLYVVDLDAEALHIDGQDGYTYTGKFSAAATTPA
ncbi:MAG: hypothetical protein WC718_00445 [Phycisphaerales bacterium]|jgi:hypothetical protein